MRKLLTLSIVPMLIAVTPAVAAPRGESGPQGIPYRCGEHGLRIAFNGQGYLPGVTVRTPYLGAATAVAQEPRATAVLSWNGHDHAMRADYTYLGLRYRSIAPYDEDHALVFTANGEDASLILIPRVEGATERALATCTRIRTVEEANAIAGQAAHGDGEHH